MPLAGRTTDPGSEHLFMLCWGVAAFTIGCFLAFNLRGVVDRFVGFLAAQQAQSGRTAPPRGTSAFRVVGTVFVLMGGGLAVLGAAGVFSVDAGSLFTRNRDLGALTLLLPFLGLLALAGFWHRRGPLRAAWATGRAVLRFAAALYCLAVLALAACLTLGLFTLGAFVLALTVVTAAITLLSLPRRGPAT
ncbi:hypothetical protein Kpho02_64010 [Kitasatospora phosalacinea]|uniref:Uncharacterized protein n=1 Tax=Kitasatospora phosalacinea TaxID=2065 RepID=A0A9W6V5A6_9ACTN|nr:hypothetical protein [Kitasatospora phosalacinea]GLW74103.1 hypothetical protein Kpho02_64010 [Kitasatospora phosalacinea]